jgi:hypothetical protein
MERYEAFALRTQENECYFNSYPGCKKLRKR